MVWKSRKEVWLLLCCSGAHILSKCLFPPFCLQSTLDFLSKCCKVMRQPHPLRHKYIRTYAHTDTHTLTCSHAVTHTHIRSHAHTHTHTHTCSLMHSLTHVPRSHTRLLAHALPELKVKIPAELLVCTVHVHKCISVINTPVGHYFFLTIACSLFQALFHFLFHWVSSFCHFLFNWVSSLCLPLSVFYTNLLPVQLSFSLSFFLSPTVSLHINEVTV